MDKEPVIHSFVTDCLPADHPLSQTSVTCDRCGAHLHASNNECMAPWGETEIGNYCLPCLDQVLTELD